MRRKIALAQSFLGDHKYLQVKHLMRSGCERIALFPFTDAAVYLMPPTAVITHDMAGQTASNLGDNASVLRENRTSALSKTGKRLCFKNYAKRKTKTIDKTAGELRDDSLTSDSANAASVKIFNVSREFC